MGLVGAVERWKILLSVEKPPKVTSIVVLFHVLTTETIHRQTKAKNNFLKGKFPLVQLYSNTKNQIGASQK